MGVHRGNLSLGCAPRHLRVVEEATQLLQLYLLLRFEEPNNVRKTH